ncbi:4-(cytidine 5'-diphospho)-2-C-methyl-D-erythritol kinase [Yunchengibacter salinarum]|uniref:4-(cytidine 5'-diphospho)-2-C-methyl-D-erythritol kinase n=1 Tax=Yunchengibacter salinarum TaxID=3133399 RepID=UPI0035B5C642
MKTGEKGEGVVDSGDTVAESAPAKLNLWLAVTGRRDDGFHLLDSLFHFTRFGDRISVAPASRSAVSPGPDLTITGPFADALRPASHDNLVSRAVCVLARHLGRAPDVSVRLDKRVPVAAGLGGGSADAAAALRAVNRLWGQPVDGATLARLGATLGADVPACLAATPQWVGGIGDRLTPAALDWSGAVVLVNPGVALSTGAVFQGFRDEGRFAPALSDAARAAIAADPGALAGAGGNSLEPAARRLCPAVDRVLAALGWQTAARLVRMSGSGATCFALFDRPGDAEAAADRLRRAAPDWWVVASPLVAG